MPLGLDELIPTESDRVEAWRLREALRMDVPLEQAERFAASDGDLHRLEKLIRAGCDPALAVEILA